MVPMMKAPAELQTPLLQQRTWRQNRWVQSVSRVSNKVCVFCSVLEAEQGVFGLSLVGEKQKGEN